MSEADFTPSYEGVNPIERAFMQSRVAEITRVVSTKRTSEGDTRGAPGGGTPGGT